jgi:hypothetical protein
VNDVFFKVSMEALHEAGHYYRVRYDWMNVAPDGTVSTIDLDTGFFKEWNLL